MQIWRKPVIIQLRSFRGNRPYNLGMMKNTRHFIVKFSLLIFALTLGACDVTITPSVPSLATPQTPVATPSPLPPTIAPIILEVSPTPDPIYFRDNFEGNLQSGWSWLREIPGQWSLQTVPGFLQISAGRGSVNAETMTNILLRPAPAGDFQIETVLTFQPDSNFQFAGLVIYQNNGNFIQAGHAFCRGGGCVRKGLYMDLYNNGLITPPNFAQTFKNGNTVLLRLIRKGTHYTFQASANGRVFYTVGEHESGMTPLQVGILAGQNVDGDTDIPALFDYFQITTPQ